MLMLTLVRHGNTDANNERWLQGHIDTVLNQNGLMQAELCSKRLQHEHYDHVYCSDLERCKQTTAAIVKHHPQVSVDYISLLRERDFGKLSGKPLAFLTTESQRQKLSMNNFISQHGGESEEVFKERIITAWKYIIDDATSRRFKSVLVITHGGPLKYLSMYWLENGFQPAEDIAVAPVAQGNTAVTRVNYRERKIDVFNSTSHLKDLYSNQPPPPAV
ncbi:histidine phosphatase superfamily [Mycotypha africana]|uniref:histidine phosphatase superfamily n=1 Tax=Mycotypha africana TaxID=64632 RepID=UPI002300E357|nr:histidine phosphatase superfamily [Mycotypha africana]KAI8968889.1 histidine phosphatase superfamily [Mycotypha africana]